MNRTVGIFLLLVGLLAGCTTAPYRYHKCRESEDTLRFKPDERQIEKGEPYWFLDGFASWTFGLPGKAILLNCHIDNHDIRDKTIRRMEAYLRANHLKWVKVRINQYAPLEEWNRLFHNAEVHWGWRYTFGLIDLLIYTLLPGRLFGGDNYDPYTNTINIYSDLPVITYHEGGHAKDFMRRKWKGTYSAIGILPLVPLIHEYIATSDAISYTHDIGDLREKKRCYYVLYPAYMTYVGGEILDWLPIPTWMYYAGMVVAVVPGHVIGRIKAAATDPEDLPPAKLVSGGINIFKTDPVPEYGPVPPSGSVPLNLPSPWPASALKTTLPTAPPSDAPSALSAPEAVSPPPEVRSGGKVTVIRKGKIAPPPEPAPTSVPAPAPTPVPSPEVPVPAQPEPAAPAIPAAPAGAGPVVPAPMTPEVPSDVSERYTK